MCVCACVCAARDPSGGTVTVTVVVYEVSTGSILGQGLVYGRYLRQRATTLYSSNPRTNQEKGIKEMVKKNKNKTK